LSELARVSRRPARSAARRKAPTGGISGSGIDDMSSASAIRFRPDDRRPGKAATRDFPILSVLLTLLAIHAGDAGAQGFGDPTPVAGNRHEVVHISADDGLTISALLMYPETGMNRYAPAMVLHHGGFGGHPARQVSAPRFIAERLSAAGYTTLSILSRQSAGHTDSLFEESRKDIKAAVDFLAGRGMEDIVLAGHSLGSVRVSGYMADTKDPRVKAVVHYAPTADLPEFQRELVGDETYAAQVRRARESVAAGRGRLDLSPDPDGSKGLDPDPVVDLQFTFQSPAAFLSWWGPAARTRNTDLFAATEVPILMLAGTEDAYVPQGRMKALQQAAVNAPVVDYLWYLDGDHFFSGFQGRAARDTALWLERQGLGVEAPVRTRLVDARLASGRYFPAVLYAPGEGRDGTGPAFLLQHGFAETILQGSSHRLGVRLAQAGYPALAPMARSSGVTGAMGLRLDELIDDLGVWMDFLAARGHRRIVMAGRGEGSLWIALYAARRQDPRLQGLVFLAPAGDLPSSTRASLGDGKYDATVGKARSLVAAGKGNSFITDKFYSGPKGARSMFIQRAESWLNYRGEDAIALSRVVTAIDMPMIALAGPEDAGVDPVYLNRLKASAAAKMTVKRYAGDEGAVTAHEDRIARDIVTWTREQFSGNRASDP